MALHALIVALTLVAVGCGGAAGAQKADESPQMVTRKSPPLMPAPAVPETPAPAPDASRYETEPLLLLDEPSGRGPRDLAITAVGDVSQPATQWVESVTEIADKAFDPTRHLVKSSDLGFMNLENPVTDKSPNAKKTYSFTSPPERLDWYFGAGFNMYSLANNHIADAGQPGIEATIANLEAYAKRNGTPVYHAGAGTTPAEGLGPTYFQPEGKELKVAFFSLGFSRSENVGKFWDDLLLDKIREADGLADIVFVSVHAGKEYKHVPEPDLVARYRSWIDAGADLVVGHHTHCVQPVEAYKDGLIFYSLGNFVFASRTVRHRKMGAKLYGMLVRIVIKNGRVRGAEIVPTWVNNSEDWVLPDGQKLPNANFVPQILTGVWADAFFADLERWATATGATVPERRGDVGFIRVQTDANRGLIAGPEDDAARPAGEAEPTAVP